MFKKPPTYLLPSDSTTIPEAGRTSWRVGEQGAEAGTTDKQVLGKMLKKELVPSVWLLLAGA